MDHETIRTVSGMLATGGVSVTAASLWFNRVQARTTFEDGMAREYRDIAASLPPEAFYASGVAEMRDEHKAAMFRYFDLSNEQLRLIGERRIRKKTADVWREGISALMRRDTFRRHWEDLHEGLPTDFFAFLSMHLSGTPMGDRHR